MKPLAENLARDRESKPNEPVWLFWISLYFALLLVIICYLNYTQLYSSAPVTQLVPWQLGLWALLYLPAIVLPLAARWKVSELGFVINPYMAVAFLLVTALCAAIGAGYQTSLTSSAVEAYARTGEELFFRGFLFAVLLRLFQGKRSAWLWAAILSSLFFTLAHTQVFTPAYYSQNQALDAPPVPYQIIEALFNVFLIAFVLALLRAWTGSILPGAVVHAVAKGGILALPFVLLVYFLGIFWAYRRGEQAAVGMK